jgi:hypothetical protein
MKLWDKVESAVVPCEVEFTTFEDRFVRRMRGMEGVGDGLLPHQLLSDLEYYGETKVADIFGRVGAEIKDGRLVVLVPEQWQRLKSVLGSNVVRYVSSRLMDRIQDEQNEYKQAMGLFDELACSDALADKELSSLLLEYIASKREYINRLRHARRGLENLQNQADKLLALLGPYRQSSYIDDDTE